jgi:hypothetical protein
MNLSLCVRIRTDRDVTFGTGAVVAERHGHNTTYIKVQM